MPIVLGHIQLRLWVTDIDFMEWFSSQVSNFGSWLSSHLDWISIALVSTLLVIYGNDINRAVRRWVATRHFLIRVGVFIALCAFGYGAAINILAPWLENFLGSLDGRYLVPVVFVLFGSVGLIAERKNQL